MLYEEIDDILDEADKLEEGVSGFIKGAAGYMGQKAVNGLKNVGNKIKQGVSNVVAAGNNGSVKQDINTAQKKQQQVDQKTQKLNDQNAQKLLKQYNNLKNQCKKATGDVQKQLTQKIDELKKQITNLGWNPETGEKEQAQNSANEDTTISSTDNANAQTDGNQENASNIPQEQAQNDVTGETGSDPQQAQPNNGNNVAKRTVQSEIALIKKQCSPTGTIGKMISTAFEGADEQWAGPRKTQFLANMQNFLNNRSNSYTKKFGESLLRESFVDDEIESLEDIHQNFIDAACELYDEWNANNPENNEAGMNPGEVVEEYERQLAQLEDEYVTYVENIGEDPSVVAQWVEEDCPHDDYDFSADEIEDDFEDAEDEWAYDNANPDTYDGTYDFDESVVRTLSESKRKNLKSLNERFGEFEYNGTPMHTIDQRSWQSKEIRKAVDTIMQFSSNLDEPKVGIDYDDETDMQTFCVEWDNMNPLYIQTAREEFEKLQKDGIEYAEVNKPGTAMYARAFYFYL